MALARRVVWGALLGLVVAAALANDSDVPTSPDDRPDSDENCTALEYNERSGLVAQYKLTKKQIVGMSFWGDLSVAMSRRAAVPELDGQQIRSAAFLQRDKLLEVAATIKQRQDAGTWTRERYCIITSVVDKCAGMADVVLPNKRAYAERHGYSLRALTDADTRPSCPTVSGRCRNAHYLKFSLILEALDSGECDWAFWADGDALFLNHDVPLEAFTSGLLATDKDAHNGTDLLLSWWESTRNAMNQKMKIMKDVGPITPSPLQDRQMHQLNSGHFFVRNSEWSRAWLLEAAQMSDRQYYKYWNDQGNMADLVQRRGLQDVGHFTWYTVRAFNSFWPGDWHKDDFIVHANGACRKPRAEVGDYMRSCAEKTGAQT